MSTIKKNFTDIVEFLEQNKDKKVDTVLQDVIEMCTSKKKASTVKYDEDNNVVEIFCYYHKEWESIELYGKKSSSHTSYNTMCKEGVNNWTRQQTKAKKALAELPDRLIAGDIKIEDLESEKQKIEKEKNKIIPRSK